MDQNILEITDAQFDGVIGEHKLVLVDFWAPWCGPCLKLAPVIEQLAAIYKGKAAIAKLNISENSQTPARYSITTIPTMLLFHQGQQVDRLVGNLPIIQIQEVLDKYLS
ncbi:MAG: thioredoxin [Candidatus Cardinium sp.]|uniref:thioredoxin n=1 Tax=Cardinium endosymbiont of Dermatophagoides farinae TaxID=2597823 RepID=UPI0011832633|nr:thioredoxin [Cardinium endosymbiont of Dermatophagoides farinae]TSJ80886.1 thioredoxin [Cardinium endosymbiont of Dermatophagoides farinae]UWW96897.1 MAG: thioredoxin [Candidatus Cardinium sp.]